MNYNNPNQAPKAPFPPQYGGGNAPSYPGGAPGYPPQAPTSGAGYPSLAGLGGGQPPQAPYGGSAYPPQQSGYGGSAYPPQQPGYGSNPYPAQPGSAYPSPQSQTYPQPPYGGGGAAAAGGYPPYQQSVGQQGYRPNYSAPFDERVYLQKLFNEIDSNRDGRITGQELHEALRRGQPTSEFDPYTIQTLIEKYDSDRDNQISVHEFTSLFGHLNAQLNEFYDFDSDNSGSIDGRELGNILRRKGYLFSPDLFNYIVYEISRRSGKPGVNFDTYVRVIARFDFLKGQYSRNPQLQHSVPLEKYIRDTFF